MNDKGWSPYTAGALVGLLLVVSVVISGNYFGASTTFDRSAGMIEKAIAPQHLAKIDYFKKVKPVIDWQWIFVAGIFIGSLLAALVSRTFRLVAIPPMWQERFGKSILKRAVVAFIGGAIAVFGARLAGGCPSGHGLSGAAQLAISGLIAFICFFVGGIIVANLLYKGGQKS